MNISEALKKIRQLKGELSRWLKYRWLSFYVIVPDDTSFDKISEELEKHDHTDFAKATEKINEITPLLIDLREKILITNLQTKVKLPDNTEITLAKLKLLIDEIRSELAHLGRLNKMVYYGLRKHELLTKTNGRVIQQIKDIKIEKMIKVLEEKKVNFEKILEQANTTTILI